MHHQFGSGSLYGIVTSGGIAVPRKFGQLQDVAIDAQWTKKKLYGQNTFALVIVRGQGSITGKAKQANINADQYNDLLFGQTSAAGSATPVLGETAVIPTTPFQVTVANGATFALDLGVVDTTTGLPMLRVTSGPTTGQYSVNTATGVYTFATADVGHGVAIDYTYTQVAVGKTITLLNTQAGTTPNFKCVFAMKSAASPGNAVKTLLFTFNLCVSDKFSLATKLEDFTIPEFDFEVSADAGGVIGTLAFQE